MNVSEEFKKLEPLRETKRLLNRSMRQAGFRIRREGKRPMEIGEGDTYWVVVPSRPWGDRILAALGRKGGPRLYEVHVRKGLKTVLVKKGFPTREGAAKYGRVAADLCRATLVEPHPPRSPARNS